MNNRKKIPKGSLMEEALRDYFRGVGYYVIRGAKFEYNDNEVTDIDLMLFGRFSSLTRERINVDIKNKKTPQALERIFWAKGVQDVLNFDNCIVATTDKRDDVREFGKNVGVTVLDGKFLNKLKRKSNGRLTENRFLELVHFKSGEKYAYNWKEIYENSKSRLINKIDFSGINENLVDIKLLVEDTLSETQRREISCRVLYCVISHFLISMDYILKDIAFLDDDLKRKRLIDGFKYGNLGKEGVEKAAHLLNEIDPKNKSNKHKVLDLFEDLDVTILVEYFSRNENIKQLFTSARKFEQSAFMTGFVNPVLLPTELKSILYLLLDHLDIDREVFAELFSR